MRYVLLLPIIFILACKSGNENKPSANDIPLGGKYAKGYSMASDSAGYTVVVTDPWQGSTGMHYTYRFVRDANTANASNSYQALVRIPVRNVVCMSSTHAAFIESLGEINSISGLSGTQFAVSPNLRKRVDENKLTEIGFDQYLNYEQIVKLKPDLVLVFGVGPEVQVIVNRLETLGISAVFVSDYLENLPLGRAEWIKFFGVLFDKYQVADSIFTQTEKNYLQITQNASTDSIKPLIMCNLPMQDTWWVPGGDSFFAKLISDAGGNYIWSHKKMRESLALSMENVLVNAGNADIWLNVGNISTYNQLLAREARIQSFKPFREKRVFTEIRENNAGSAFYESGAVYPDSVLLELTEIMKGKKSDFSGSKYFFPLK